MSDPPRARNDLLHRPRSRLGSPGSEKEWGRTRARGRPPKVPGAGDCCLVTGLPAAGGAGGAVGARAKPGSGGGELRGADLGGPSLPKRPGSDWRPRAGAIFWRQGPRLRLGSSGFRGDLGSLLGNWTLLRHWVRTGPLSSEVRL